MDRFDSGQRGHSSRVGRGPSRRTSRRFRSRLVRRTRTSPRRRALMKLYLDTSALVKLVAREPHSPALRRYLETHASDTRFTSALARTELIRAVSRYGPSAAIAQARRLLTRLDTVALSIRLLDVAA